MNRYLKELGLSEENWLEELKNSKENHFIPDDTGLSAADTYDMRLALAATIYIYLRKFKETERISFPANITTKKWEQILDEMINGFASFIKGEETHRAFKRQKRALALFKTWFWDLWW